MPRPPVLAARYQLVRVIGRGATGEVWQALDLRTSQQVAAKVCSTARTPAAHRFLHEQSVRVRHRHVLAPHGWAAEDDLVLVVSELVRGGSVDDLLAEHGPLPVAWVARLVAQVADGLAAVHAVGAVHRDVSGANVLLMPSPPGRPEARLADFGQAAPIGTRPLPRATPGVAGPEGTAGFVAPEAATSNDPAQDLWSLGALAVLLVTGRTPPRPGADPERWHRELPLTALGALEPLTRWLLSPDADSRPSAARARDAARGLIADHGLAADGPAVPDRLRPPAGWHHWVALVLLLGLTLTAAVGAWLQIGVGGGP